VVVHEKYQQHLQELFPLVNAAAITRERLSISVVLKLFQFPEHPDRHAALCGTCKHLIFVLFEIRTLRVENFT
jgi:hypothetical protein